MNKDLANISKLLRERFPKSRVVDHRGSGSDPMIELNFKNTSDSIVAIEVDEIVTLLVIRHANSQYFKKYPDHIQKFAYQSPQHLVSRFVDMADLLLKEMQEFEAEENAALSQWSTQRPLADPEISPALKTEIQ